MLNIVNYDVCQQSEFTDFDRMASLSFLPTGGVFHLEKTLLAKMNQLEGVCPAF